MFSSENTSRRGMIKGGLAAVVCASLTIKEAEAKMKKKAPGETKVVYLGGDQLHNGMGQRQSIRGILGPTGWKMYFTSDARYVTPEVLKDTDILMITRWGGAIEGWCPDPFQSEAMPGDGYMSDELEDAIVDNVLNRGMGFMAFHCTCWTPERQKFNDMMGIKGIMHGPVQTVHLHDFNQDHPITAGIEDFDMPLDENFGVELTNENAVTLFESTGTQDKRHDIAGWCLENGKGRVVGLVAGHTYTSWRSPDYQKLYWRGAHWVLDREIPPYKTG